MLSNTHYSISFFLTSPRQLSNPAVLPSVCLLASLQLFSEATMPALRAKSEKLTAYLEALLDRFIRDDDDDDVDGNDKSGDKSGNKSGDGEARYTQLTPRDPTQRGCQISVLVHTNVKAVHDRLAEQGVICDVREPNVIRVSPVPMYNT
jgi:kynureninase